jgi:hypothetical protein
VGVLANVYTSIIHIELQRGGFGEHDPFKAAVAAAASVTGTQVLMGTGLCSKVQRTYNASTFRGCGCGLLLRQTVSACLTGQLPWRPAVTHKMVTMCRCCCPVCRTRGYVCICMRDAGRNSAVQQTWTSTAAAAAAVWPHAGTSSTLAIADHLAAVYVGGLCHVLVCT